MVPRSSLLGFPWPRAKSFPLRGRRPPSSLPSLGHVSLVIFGRFICISSHTLASSPTLPSSPSTTSRHVPNPHPKPELKTDPRRLRVPRRFAEGPLRPQRPHTRTRSACHGVHTRARHTAVTLHVDAARRRRCFAARPQGGGQRSAHPAAVRRRRRHRRHRCG